MSLWDLVQQEQIHHLSRRQVMADSNQAIGLTQARSRDENLEDRFDRLVLLTEAMWDLLSERFGLTVAELAAHVDVIDGRDGKVNRKRAAAAPSGRRCPSCDAVVPTSASACQFCGAAAAPDGADPFAV